MATDTDPPRSPGIGRDGFRGIASIVDRMAFLGRSSQSDELRAQRFKAWVETRNKCALASVPLGCIAVLDAFTVVLGVAIGLVAIAMGVTGLKQIARETRLAGRRLCYLGISLGTTAVVSSVLIGMLLYRS